MAVNHEISIAEAHPRKPRAKYFGSEAILRICNMLERRKEMKEKYENNEVTKKALQDWKANYSDSLKKIMFLFIKQCEIL